MAGVLVSVIVPVYNSEKTLAACVNSILTQSYSNLQVLLVNDGSTDSSLTLCHQFAAKDSRITVVDQANAGVSAARNAALAIAIGTYYQFVDSDDKISPHTIAHMLRLCQTTGSDLVIARYYLKLGRESTILGLIDTNGILTPEEYILKMRSTPCSYYVSVLWNKMYRADIIQQNHIIFDTSLPWGEDFSFNAQYLQYINQVATTSGAYYYYVKNIRGLSVRSAIHVWQNICVKMRMYGYYKNLLKSRKLKKICWDSRIRFFSNMPLYD